MRVIEVAAAIIERRGKFLVTRRNPGQHLAGHWEFPGGKRRPGESWKRCLARELREELSLRARIGKRLQIIEHEYPERAVRIAFYRCEILSGSPRPREGQAARWVAAQRLGSLKFPAADQQIVLRLARRRQRKW